MNDRIIQANTFIQNQMLAGLRDALQVHKGSYVRVARGRKVPRGTTGRVFWTAPSQYGGFRVGIDDLDGGTHWTAMANCDVTDYQDYLPDYESIVLDAAAHAADKAA